MSFHFSQTCSDHLPFAFQIFWIGLTPHFHELLHYTLSQQAQETASAQQTYHRATGSCVSAQI